MTQHHKVAACAHASINGPLVVHNDALYILPLSTSNFLRTSGECLQQCHWQNCSGCLWNEGTILAWCGWAAAPLWWSECKQEIRFSASINTLTKFLSFQLLTNRPKINLKRFMQCVATLAREVDISALLFECIIPADIPTVVCNSISSHHAPDQNEVEHQNDEKEVEFMSPGEKQYTPPDLASSPGSQSTPTFCRPRLSLPCFESLGTRLLLTLL